jgi:hypothetical protein
MPRPSHASLSMSRRRPGRCVRDPLDWPTSRDPARRLLASGRPGFRFAQRVSPAATFWLRLNVQRLAAVPRAFATPIVRRPAECKRIARRAIRVRAKKEAFVAAFEYAAKFVCGKPGADELAPGVYFTAINVHNPTERDVKLRKEDRDRRASGGARTGLRVFRCPARTRPGPRDRLPEQTAGIGKERSTDAPAAIGGVGCANAAPRRKWTVVVDAPAPALPRFRTVTILPRSSRLRNSVSGSGTGMRSGSPASARRGGTRFTSIVSTCPSPPAPCRRRARRRSRGPRSP